MTRIHGLSAFPITPADASGRVDTAALAVLLTRLVDAGVHSVGLLGTTGSYPYLSRTERRRTIEAAAVYVAGRAPILAGIGALRTDDAVLLAQDARTAGAAAGLLAPVSYTPLLDDEVFTHFETVAREGGLPLVVYNNPATTHFTFTTGLLARLSRVPGIVAVKNPAPAAEAVPAHLQELRAAAAPDFSLGYSVDAHAAEALLAGGVVWYSVAGGLFPRPCMAIVAAVQAGDAAEARRLNAGLAPLWELFREHTSLRVMYAAANLLGLCRAAPPRPILPLPEVAQHRVGEVLKQLKLAA